MSDDLVVGDLHLALRFSPRRRTMQITVDRGCELVLYAPQGCPLDRLRKFVRTKRMWIYTKLAQKELLQKRAAPPKEFVTGEGFYYLGHSYRLKLVPRQDRPVKLVAGRLCLLRAERERGREHLVDWYSEHAQPWFRRRAELLAPRMKVQVKDVRVRDLGHRWGSCGRKGALNFHWATILLPPRVVEYVVVHELAHRRHASHSREFWKTVTMALPDFAERKAWLAENGAAFAALVAGSRWAL